MNDFDPVAAALTCGATKAASLSPAGIVTDPAFFDVCRSNGCGHYAACYNCPPYERPDAENAASLAGYRYGLLWQTVGAIEDSFDFEGMAAVRETHRRTSIALREAFRAAGIEALHLSCGGCSLCAVCARRTGEPCRHPETVMPAMEGYGIDVYRTARLTPLRYTNGPNTVTYFGLVCYGGEICRN